MIVLKRIPLVIMTLKIGKRNYLTNLIVSSMKTTNVNAKKTFQLKIM